MLALGALAYESASDLLKDRTVRQLNSLAESKKEELEGIIEGWEERVSLIASRTQLRDSLRAYNVTASAGAREQIGRILSDAHRSSESVRSLTVYDLEGSQVTTVGRGPEPAPARLDPARLPQHGDTIVFEGISFLSGDEPRATFVASLILEGDRIGALRVMLSADELMEVIQNFIGLGETGETMIVLQDEAGVTRVLHPVRQRAAERPGPVRPEGPNDPAALSLRGEEGPFTEGLIDYRGERVWAATRFLPEVGWGVVVKFDAAEERAPIRQFRGQLTRLGLSLSAFAILLGTFLGLRLTRPIHALARVADRIRLGELTARARVEREDELGLLARTFNEMAEELERQVTLLNEFEKYFELAMDMLCIAGTDGYFKRVNPAFERTLGWTPEELLSRPFVDFVHPDDVEATLREMEKLSRGIPTISFENRYRCADGTYKHLLWRTHPEPETGTLYAIARDITELKRAKERLGAREGTEPSDGT